jgi:hypothetical protein
LESKRKKRRSRAKGIAETYIHIKDVPESLTKQKAREYLLTHIGIWAEQSFKNEVKILISIEDGSLIARVRVGGQTLVCMLALYGSIRAGIDYLVDDAWSFSDTVIEHFVQDEQIPEQSIVRAERRLGVPGKIQRFYKRLDKLNSDNYSHNQRQDEIEYLQDEFISIIELLEAPEDREAFMSDIPDLISSQLHEPLPAPVHGAISLEDNNQDEGQFFMVQTGLPAPTDPPLPAPNYRNNLPIINREEDNG